MAASRLLTRLARLIGYPFFLPTSVFIGLELTVRLFMPQVLPRDAPEIYVPDPAVGWRHAQDLRTTVNTGERAVELCLDDKGDRVSCSEPAPARCSRRILVVGDSFVEALAIPFEETAWWRLQQDTGACVDAAGVGAYYPSQYLAVARERLRAQPGRYQALILSFYVGNDFIDDAERIPAPTDVWRRPLRLFPAGLSRIEIYDWLYPYNQWLESRSQAYVAIRFAIRRFQDPGDVGIYGVPRAFRISRLSDAHIEQSARAIALAAEEAHRAGIPLIVTLVPILNQVLDPDGLELRDALPEMASDIDVNLVTRLFVPRLMAIGGIDVVDLLPALRQNPSRELWGVRDRHFSPQGHAAWFASLRQPVRRALGLESGTEARR